MQSNAAGPPDTPEARITRDEQGSPWVRLSGVWNLRALEPLMHAVEARLAEYGGGRAAWDLTVIQTLDQAGALRLWRAWGRRMREQLRARPELVALFSRFQ